MPAIVVNKHFQEYDVYIGRPSKWGNPFVIGRDGDRHEVIMKYLDWLQTQPALLEALPELKGKRLGCSCKPAECHGDILAELVNTLYPERPHKWHECHCGECYTCKSELTYCEVCGGFEGTLTTDCCGRRLTQEETHRIYDLGNLDFRFGRWVDKPNHTRFDEDGNMICVDGVKRTREQFSDWCKKLKQDEHSTTDGQLARLS